MRGYYYLMASLPSLSLASGKAPLTKEAFLESIRLFVPGRDFEFISGLMDGKDVRCRFLSEYLSLKKTVDELIAEKRAARLSWDIDKAEGDSVPDSSVLELVSKAVGSENPFEAEMNVLMLYWKCAERAAGLHKFDLVELSLYALKLSMLLRIDEFDEKRGAEEFGGLQDSLSVSLEGVQ